MCVARSFLNRNRGGTPAHLLLFLADMSHGPAPKAAPHDLRFREGWRRACVAYRECLREGHPEWISAHYARHALWLVVPELTYDDADQQAMLAISYASMMHPEWLWNGTSGVPARPKMPFVPPHVITGPRVLARTKRVGCP
jgi:hypothetical protein